MTKYAVIKSHYREDYKPYKGCYLVTRETSSSVWVEFPNSVYHPDDGAHIEQFRKTNVWFYTDKDISEDLKVANESIIHNQEAHGLFSKTIIQEVKNRFSND